MPTRAPHPAARRATEPDREAGGSGRTHAAHRGVSNHALARVREADPAGVEAVVRALEGGSEPPLGNGAFARLLARWEGDSGEAPLVAPLSEPLDDTAESAEPAAQAPLPTQVAGTDELAIPTSGPLEPVAGEVAEHAGEAAAMQAREQRADFPPAAEEVAPAEPPARTAPRTPANDSGFQATVQRVEAVAAAEMAHEPAATVAGAAQAAAPGPVNEVSAAAGARQVSRMEQEEPKPFDRAGFKQRLVAKIDAVAPDNPKQARAFSRSGKLTAVRDDLGGEVARTKEQAQGGLARTATATPDTANVEGKSVTPLEPRKAGPPPPRLGAAAATPGPRPEAQVSTPLIEGTADLDQAMADADVDDAQLAAGNEPSFSAALAAKTDTGTHAAQAPDAYRHAEAARLADARAGAEALANDDATAMHDTRIDALAQVVDAQHATMREDERERAAVSTHIEGVYERTKTAVEARLQQIDDDVDAAFTDGAQQARQAFEDFVDARLRERYRGARGKARWLDDKVLTFGVPAAIERYFQHGRQHYISAMDAVLERVAGIVETGLSDAMAFVAAGRQEIAEYVSALPASLQHVGQEAAQDIGKRFDALEQSVTAKQDELLDSLARRYTEELGELDARIEELQAEHRGLLGKAFDAVGGAIRVILELKNLLLGVLAKVADSVSRIIKDPIAFLGNLVAGVRQGLEGFLSNIVEHLQAALKGWLFGALARAGLSLPERLDLRGILSLVMQVLGLTYQAVRGLAVHLVGEDVVTRLEQFAEPFVAFLRDGPGALWDWIKDKLANLKDMVLGQIEDFVITRVIRAGITWIVSLLNPAAAFIKACKAIYNIVTFFIERGRQVAELVHAVVDSVAAIARGSLSGAAKFIENALAKALPVVLSFLASLLGLGGISDTIRGIIEKAKAPVQAALEWLVGKAVELVKATGRLVGIGSDVEAEPVAATDSAQDLPAGAVISVAEDVTVEGTLHSIETVGATAELVMRSTPRPLSQHHDPDVVAAYRAYLTVALDEDLPGREARVNAEVANVLAAVRAAGIDPQNPGFSAPGIGDVQRHSVQQSKLHKSRVKTWWMRSEHIAAKGILSEYLTAIFGSGGALSKAEYEHHHTILTYFEASKPKDFDPKQGDLPTLRRMRAGIRRDDDERTLDLVEQFEVNQATMHMTDQDKIRSEFGRVVDWVIDESVKITVAGIRAEHAENGVRRGESDPVPSEKDVEYAAGRQREDVMQQLDVRLGETDFE